MFSHILGQTCSVGIWTRTWVKKTAQHQIHKEYHDATRAFLQADMAILGASAERYAQYAEQVQAEYIGLTKNLCG